MKRSVLKPPGFRLIMIYLAITVLAGTLSLLQIDVHDRVHLRFLTVIHSIGSTVTPDLVTNNSHLFTVPETEFLATSSPMASYSAIPSTRSRLSTLSATRVSSTYLPDRIHHKLVQHNMYKTNQLITILSLDTTEAHNTTPVLHTTDRHANRHESRHETSKIITSSFSASSSVSTEIIVAIMITALSFLLTTFAVSRSETRTMCFFCSLIALYALHHANLCCADTMELGADSSCALLTSQNNAVKCWGNGADGQLGYENTESRGDAAYEMGINSMAIDFGAGVRAKFLSPAANNHRCVISEANQTKCFGLNSQGQLGIGDRISRGNTINTMGDFLPALDLGDGFIAKQVVCGYEHTCALSEANTVKCFGEFFFGALGNPLLSGDRLSAGSLAAVDLGDDFVPIGISVGWGHTCTWSETGTVKCWGYNLWNQLGSSVYTGWSLGGELGDMGNNLLAVNLGSNFFVHQVCAGRSHTCALSTAGAVKCFGNSGNGQCGLELERATAYSYELGDNLPVVDLGRNFVVTAIACGWYHTCALSSTHIIKCFGDNSLGQLGYGDTVERGYNLSTMGTYLPAVDVGTDFIPKEVKCGKQHTCATSQDDKMKCWGNNESGQLGYEDTNHRGDEPGEMGDDLPVINLLEYTSQPTSNPTVPPTRRPSPSPIAPPTSDPTVAPTRSSTQPPSAAPSSPPTPSPTAAPTSSPTTAPTVSPTQSPTAKPSVSPTKSPTSAHPTPSPTRNPTSTPSTAPTQSPTYCSRAKYLSWMNADDYLWANETLISANCLCRLVMQSNGDLLLQHRAKRSSTFITAWHSNTSIGNYSGESVPRLEIKDDARFVIIEYAFKWAMDVSKRPVWQNSNTQQTPNQNQSLSVKLYLSDSGCLQLLDDENSADILHQTVWYVCADRSELYSDETLTSTTTNSDDDDESLSGTETRSASRGRDGDPLEDPWWIWLILAMVVLSAMIVLVLCRRLKNEKMAVSANNAFDDDDDSGDEEQDTTDAQLKAWVQETELVAMNDENDGRTVTMKDVVREDEDEQFMHDGGLDLDVERK